MQALRLCTAGDASLAPWRRPVQPRSRSGPVHRASQPAALRRRPSVLPICLQVISGGEKHRLDEVFSDLPIWLAAENGAVIRPPGEKVRAPRRPSRPLPRCQRARRLTPRRGRGVR